MQSLASRQDNIQARVMWLSIPGLCEGYKQHAFPGYHNLDASQISRLEQTALPPASANRRAQHLENDPSDCQEALALNG
jgi:hypothetical protein